MSSGWVHDKVGVKVFAWQDGYAAFSVSPTCRPGVRNYVANQEEHHRKKSFIEELKELLEKGEVKYDVRYLE